jgi:hypothetical protein
MTKKEQRTYEKQDVIVTVVEIVLKLKRIVTILKMNIEKMKKLAQMTVSTLTLKRQ